MDIYAIINYSTTFFSLFVVAVLTVGVLLGGNLQEKPNRWFFFTVLFLLLGVLNEVAIGLLPPLLDSPERLLVKTLEVLSYALWGLQVIALNKYLYEYLNTKTVVSERYFYPTYFFGVLTIVMAFVASFTQLYGSFDELGIYHQGEMFWTASIFPALALMVYSLVIFKYRKTLSAREGVSLLFYVAVLIACYLLTIFIPDLWVAYAGAAISIFIIYVNIQAELKQQLIKQQAQLDESRSALMLSQIQPHFLYNTLTAISGQCQESPGAQQSILLFSQYLRGNMDSLSQKIPIPFEDELKHTKQYVRLEKLRFGERLKVEYDIKTTDFVLPVLSLQPLVENAVRHGVTKTKEGGTIKISAKETEDSYCIVVEDDGAGFVPEQVLRDGQKHVGIENVRNRLEAMSGGSLVVESMVGEGTRAVIDVPKRG